MCETNKAVVHVIDKFQMNSHRAYRCIFIYQDLDSGYCLLRPLLHKSDTEIITEVFKIMTSFVPARTVLVHSCSSRTVHALQKHFDVLCPALRVEFVRRCTGNNQIVIEVATRLSKWMSAPGHEAWDVGCRLVQRDLNLLASSGDSPRDRYFSTELNGTEQLTANITKPTSPQPNQMEQSEISTVRIKQEVMDTDTPDPLEASQPELAREGPLVEIKVERFEE